MMGSYIERMVARGGIEPPTRGFSVSGSAAPPPASRRPGTVYLRTTIRVASDRTHAERGRKSPVDAVQASTTFNELLALLPNFDRIWAGS